MSSIGEGEGSAVVCGAQNVMCFSLIRFSSFYVIVTTSRDVTYEHCHILVGAFFISFLWPLREEGKGAEKNSRRKRLLSDKWIFFLDLLIRK
jgi:hypothetical protein